MFPVVILEGVSHWRFASGEVPFLVKKEDLNPEVDENTAHMMVASYMLQFVCQLDKDCQFD